MSQQSRTHPGTDFAEPAAALSPESMRPRLVVPDAANDPEFLPFREFGDPHLHALRVEWRSPAGDLVDSWELILQRNRYASAPLSEWEPTWTNPRIRSRLRDVARAVDRSRTGADGSGPWIGLSQDGAQTTWGPALCWTRENRFVAPRCPNSLEKLTTCTDDAALAAAGLPPYSTSAVRFLVSSRSLAAGSPRFYSDDPFPQVEAVHTVAELLADQVAVREKASESAGADEQAAEALADWTGADGRGPAAGELRVLTLHESVAIARRALGMSLLDAARLVARPVGGEPDASTSTERAGGRAGRLFAADGSGLDALEVLRLKLALFAGALGEVHALYRAGSGPHLGLAPGAFSVRFPAGADDVGGLWNGRAALIGLPAAARIPETGEPGAWRLPARTPSAYLPAVLTDGRFESTRDGTVQVAGVDGQTVSLVLHDPGSSVPPLSARDWLRVKTAENARPLAFDAWAPIGDGRDVPPGAIGLALTLPAEQAAALARWSDPIPVRYLLSPCLGAPADLSTMGVLYFEMLIGADDLPVAAIGEALGNWRAQVGREPGGGEEVSRRRIDKAIAWLDQSRFAEGFGRHRVFADPQDRREGRPNAIPGWLWRDAMLLGLRMTTWSAGFGFCRDHGDFDPNYPQQTFEPALAELRVLLERIDSILLARSPHNREVRHVLRELRGKQGRTAAPVTR